MAPTVIVVVVPTRQVSTMSTVTTGMAGSGSGDGVGDLGGVGVGLTNVTYRIQPILQRISRQTVITSD